MEIDENDSETEDMFSGKPALYLLNSIKKKKKIISWLRYVPHKHQRINKNNKVLCL